MVSIKKLSLAFLFIIPVILYAADNQSITIGSFNINNPENNTENKWVIIKEDQRHVIRHDSGYFAEVNHYTTEDVSAKITAIITDFKEANVALNIGVKSDSTENFGQNPVRHVIIEGNDAYAHLFLLVNNKELLEIRLFISKSSDAIYKEFTNFLALIRINSSAQISALPAEPANPPASETPQQENQPAPAENNILKVDIFTFKNIENNKWSVIKEGDNLTLKHEIGFTGAIHYQAGEAETIIVELVKNFKSNNASLNSEIEIDQNRQLGEIKYRMLKIKGQDDSAYLYILNVKKHVLYIEFIIWNSNPEALSEIENILSNVKIDNIPNDEPPAVQETQPAAVTPPAASQPEQTPTPLAVQPEQTPAPVTPQPVPQQQTVEPSASIPPQRVIIENENQIKNKFLFKNSIYSNDYKIKLGMKFSQVKKLLKNDNIKVFTRDDIYRMSLYKFKLLNTTRPWLEKYSKAFSLVRPLKVISMKYNDRMLLLFFYAEVLYSMKIREEGVVPADYQSTLNGLKKKFRGKTRIFEYGNHFRGKFNRFSLIEFTSYNFDTSAEITIYSIYYVKRIEKEIQRIMRNL